jgi:hypothetical protein
MVFPPTTAPLWSAIGMSRAMNIIAIQTLIGVNRTQVTPAFTIRFIPIRRVGALLKSPAIPGLTESLTDLRPIDKKRKPATSPEDAKRKDAPVPESKVISLGKRVEDEEKPFFEQLLQEGARKLLQAAIE